MTNLKEETPPGRTDQFPLGQDTSAEYIKLLVSKINKESIRRVVELMEERISKQTNVIVQAYITNVLDIKNDCGRYILNSDKAGAPFHDVIMPVVAKWLKAVKFKDFLSDRNIADLRNDCKSKYDYTVTHEIERHMYTTVQNQAQLDATRIIEEILNKIRNNPEVTKTITFYLEEILNDRQ